MAVVKRALEVAGRRFNGGPEDATQIAEWLARFDKRVDYTLNINSYIHTSRPAEIKTTQQIAFTDAHGYNGGVANPGDWIVQMPDGEFKSLSQSEFEAEYEELEG